MHCHSKLRNLTPALIAVAVIIYGAFTSAVNTRKNLEEERWVIHSYTVLLQLQSTLRLMLDLETGQRGYILVGEESYLEPYRRGLAKIDAQVASLQKLTRDNASQQMRIGRMKEVIGQRNRSLALGLEARGSAGVEAAVAQMKASQGSEQMDRIREIVDEFQTEELALLARRQQTLTASLRQTDHTVLVAGIVAVLAGSLGAYMLYQFLSARDREESLRVQKDKAEHADRAKSEFLAMMSHEIRTPMNAILGFGELLRDSVPTAQDKHFANAILSSGKSLLSLINDILDLSKIEAGKLDILAEPVLLGEFSESLETLFQFRAVEKNLAYAVHLDASVPPRLTFDALRLRQVVVNLIGNAIKFTPQGSVSVSFHADPPDAGDQVRLRIEVADTGIGIAPGQLGEIFRPFYQVDSHHGRQFQGTGLGLSISHRLVEAMSGELTVESVLGRGSVFRVSLPTRFSRRAEEILTRADAVPPAVDFNRLKPAKILVADDVPINRELIGHYLAGSHHQIIEAENGDSAVDSCLMHRPDIVLMDIRMPGTDGREALARIRADDSIRHIPLIALTASSLLDSRTELKELFDGYADKPLDRAKLYRELAKFLPAADVHPAEPTPPRPPETTAPSRDWSSLLEALESMEKSTWPNLVKLVPAQATIKFAGDLAGLAARHDCPPLVAHAAELRQAAQTMDFDQAGKLLRGFPQIIAAIRSHP